MMNPLHYLPHTRTPSNQAPACWGNLERGHGLPTYFRSTYLALPAWPPPYLPLPGVVSVRGTLLYLPLQTSQTLRTPCSRQVLHYPTLQLELTLHSLRRTFACPLQVESYHSPCISVHCLPISLSSSYHCVHQYLSSCIYSATTPRCPPLLHARPGFFCAISHLCSCQFLRGFFDKKINLSVSRQCQSSIRSHTHAYTTRR
ncbi:hypothetical protein F4777DRAFT_102060 [Nemania sp. FL0916]|nr:hypothetical protein F4777DRAFT_102060 [Nemania sp. FL0916]